MEYDVIVLGGDAGLAAAVEASSQGASVLLLEAAHKLGGSTAMPAGVYYAAETRLQREAERRRLHRKNVQVLPGTEPVAPRTIARDALLHQVGVRDRRRPHEQAAETIQKKYEEGYALRPDTLHEVTELAGIRA
jgi:flavin-dependent dehydrogenase